MGETDYAATDFESERWQARLGRLETRLEMLETQLKSEISRIELAAQSIDAVTREFRTTVGGVRNVVDLANDIGDRVSILTALEKRLSGQHDAVASAVAEQLEREIDDRRARDASIEGRFDALITALDELRLAQPDVGPHLQALAAGLAEIRDMPPPAPTPAPEPAELEVEVEGLAELQDEVRVIREELGSVKLAIDSVMDGLDRQLPEPAAIHPAPTADLGPLEARLDSEFDAIGYQVEALAVLLGEAIEAMHRIELQMVGPQPTTERMREAAASVVASLRANVRQRTLDRGWFEPEADEAGKG